MSRATRLLSTGYRHLLRFYPAPFRAEFGAEMDGVFCQAVEEAAPAGGFTLIRLVIREVIDWPAALSREWVCALQATFGARKEVTVKDRPSAIDPAMRAPWSQAILAALALLVPGLALAGKELLVLHQWWPALLLGSYLFILCGLLSGWVRSFPRWSYPYVSSGLVYAWYLSGVSMNRFRILGHLLGPDQPWSWMAWLGLAAVAIVALLLTRSLRPLGRLVQDAWRDWTRLSFALYGVLPWLIWILFDEVDRSYYAPFVIVSSLFLALGALATMQARTASGRTLAMLSGLTASWLLSTWALAGYWRSPKVPGYPPFHWSDSIGPMAVAWVFVVAILLLPALLGLLRRTMRPQGAA